MATRWNSCVLTAATTAAANATSVVSDSSRPHGQQPTRLLRQWDSPGKSTGVSCHCPLRYLQQLNNFCANRESRNRIYFLSVLCSLSVVSDSFATPWTAAHQASLSIANSWSLLKLICTESVMPSNHLTLCCPLSFCLQSFPN